MSLRNRLDEPHWHSKQKLLKETVFSSINQLLQGYQWFQIVANLPVFVNPKCLYFRYVELKEQDVLKFGYSSREYVLLHENSQTADDEDDG